MVCASLRRSMKRKRSRKTRPRNREFRLGPMNYTNNVAGSMVMPLRTGCKPNRKSVNL